MNSILLSIIYLVGTPISIYFSLKFGTYGFYRGKQLFEERQTRTKNQPN